MAKKIILNPVSGPARSTDEILAELAPALHGALRGLAAAVGSARTSVKLLAGEPADALAAFGREIGADLICLGRRQRRRGAARFGHTTAQRLLALSGLLFIGFVIALDWHWLPAGLAPVFGAFALPRLARLPNGLREFHCISIPFLLPCKASALLLRLD